MKITIENDLYGLTLYGYYPSAEIPMATYADGTKEYALFDKVGKLHNDPCKYLRGR